MPRLRHLALIAAALLLCFAISGAYLVFEDDVGLSANLITELLGIASTVFIIDRLSQRRERRRLEPARYAAFCQARLIYWISRTLWRAILQATIDQERDSAVLSDPRIDIFAQPYLAMIDRLDVSSEAPVIPRMSWRGFLEIEVERIDKAIDDFSTRSPEYLDPRTIEAINELEKSAFLQAVRYFPGLAAAYEQKGGIDRRFIKFSAESISDFGSAMVHLRETICEQQQEFRERIKDSDMLEKVEAWLPAKRKQA